MAAVINKRDVALQAASPRTVAVNLGTTVNVNGTLNGTAVATVVTNADAGASHAGLSGNPHNVSLTQIAGDLDDISNGSTYFKTTANQVTGAGRAYSSLDSSNEYIKSLTSTKMTLVGSNPSTGWVGDGNGIRMYQGGVLKVNIPVSGAPSFSGDITGGSNINITGSGIFQGNSTLGGAEAAVHINQSLGAINGLIAYGDSGTGTSAIKGIATTTNTTGVIGQANVSGAIGVRAINSFGGGVGLAVTGAMTTTSATLVSNLNADMVDGKHAASLCSIVIPDTGSCTVSGNGFNLVSTVTGVRVRGNNSNGLIIENFSDRRLKTKITQESLGLKFVKKLKPVSFELKNRPGFVYHGFIAQDLGEIINTNNDSLCQRHSDGMYGTDYISLISPMVKAIQELSAEMTFLKTKLGRVA